MKREGIMEKIIEKLGLYDIWTITFPGAIFLFALKTMYSFFVKLYLNNNSIENWMQDLFMILGVDVYCPETIYELFVFLLLSYATGTILHEIGSLIKKKIIYKNGKPKELLLNSEKGEFSEVQVNNYMSMFLSLHNNISFSSSDQMDKRKEESEMIFNQINTKLQAQNRAAKYVKLNIIHNTCLTLWVATLILLLTTLLFELEFLFTKNWAAIYRSLSIFVILIIIGLILYYRSKKYLAYWTRNIVYAYYELWKEGTAERNIDNEEGTSQNSENSD